MVKVDSGGDVREAHQRLHQRQLAWVVEFESRYALACRYDGRCGQRSHLSEVDEGFRNVLLDVEVVLRDDPKALAQRGQLVNGLADAVVAHIVGGCFRASIRRSRTYCLMKPWP